MNRRFRPSQYSYGSYGEGEVAPVEEAAPVAAPVAAPTDYTAYLQYVPFLRDFVLGADPEQAAATVRAQIENQKRMRNATPLLHAFYTNEIKKLQAKLPILDQQAAAAKTTGQIKQAGIAAGAFTAVVIGVAVLGGTVWIWRRALARPEGANR
jgi:hypothetical protein